MFLRIFQQTRIQLDEVLEALPIIFTFFYVLQIICKIIIWKKLFYKVPWIKVLRHKN